jgi:hypothetical protein
MTLPLLPLFVVVIPTWPWANPTWLKLTATPIDLSAHKVTLTSSKSIRVDDDYAHVQIDLGKNAPQISEAILHGPFDKASARAIPAFR